MSTQQMLLVGGKPPVRTYMDEVFKITGYTGNGVSGSGTRTITHGLKYGDDGGMVMTKMTKHGNNVQHRDWYVYSTGLSGSHKTNSGVYADVFHSGGELTATNNTYQVTGTGFKHNKNDHKYINYMFKKTTGFFTYKNYTGTGSTQTMTHDLGVTPAMIWIHRTNSFNTTNWAVYHRNMNKGVNPQNYRMWLNTNGSGTDEDQFGDTAPTATHFTVGGDHNETNDDGDSYTAYFFAGAESTAATARSVDFDGDDYLLAASSSDFTLTGDFTMECWYNSDNVSGVHVILNGRGSANSGGPVIYSNGTSLVFDNGAGAVATATNAVRPGSWNHVAGTRSGNTWKLYLNGLQVASGTDSTSYSSSVGFMIGQSHVGSEGFDGRISNVRLTKGQVLYTSSFIPSTEPLTQTSQGATSSNVELLCCNNSSVTGSTVTAGTISATGNPTASTNNPFDDPDAAIFGANGKEQIIKCGGYTGNGDTTNGTKIHLGFEPQLILIKSESYQEEWHIFDDLRGMKTDEDVRLELSEDGEQLTGGNFLHTDPHGFTALYNPNINKDGEYYIYMAIRREDGYVQTPADAGTDVFTIDTGNSSNVIPSMDTAFTVDMAIYTQPGSTSHNWLTTRMLGTLANGKELKINGAESEGNVGDSQWDTHVGWGINHNSNYQAWMWKRHAGFDVVTYTGNGVAGREIPHSLNNAPEMMWFKNRDSSREWAVYHNGLNGGTTPQNYHLHLEQDVVEVARLSQFNNTAPTSTHFTVGTDGDTNEIGEEIIAMLFASVAGVSHVGSYSGSSSSQTITIPNGGFQPRFVLIKRVDAGYNWYTLDTTRGWGSGDDSQLELNTNNAQASWDFGAPTSTGFTLTVADSYNTSGGKYIYYAHA